MSHAMKSKQLLLIDDQRAVALDSQIQKLHKITDFEIREYPVEVVVEKFTTGLEPDDEAELFIPDYQREFVWSKDQRSRFIESILLSLPIPYIFVADVAEGKNEGRLEIVDGSQRVRTLVEFLQDKLRLQNLKKLTEANGFIFSQMSGPRQMRFKRKTLRMIELTEQADEEARREIFDRLNSGGTKIESMEQRRGSEDGRFLTFIEKCAQVPLFQRLCPVSKARSDRAEYAELVLRYFAYSAKYLKFSKSVDTFLTDYLKEWNLGSSEVHEAALQVEFDTMLRFIEQYIPNGNGFRKNTANKSVPRIRFEALAIGTTLALREQPQLVPQDISNWLDSEEFRRLTRSDASNSRPRVIDRLHFVRDSLLGRPVEYASTQITEGQVDPTDDALI
jgi:hypothetical protein